MSIQSTKLVNLEDAQVLYNDLRDRESDLKSALNDIAVADTIGVTWAQGYIKANGNIGSDSATCYTSFVVSNGYEYFITVANGYTSKIAHYAADESFIGNVWTGGTGTQSFRIPEGHKFRVQVAITSGTLEPSDITDLVYTGYCISYTDKTLTESGKPADAKVAGDSISNVNTIINRTIRNVNGEITGRTNYFGISENVDGTLFPLEVNHTYHIKLTFGVAPSISKIYAQSSSSSTASVIEDITALFGSPSTVMECDYTPTTGSIKYIRVYLTASPQSSYSININTVAIGGAIYKINNDVTNIEELTYQKCRMKFGAHQGSRLKAPENSIPAYTIAGQDGWDYLWLARLHCTTDHVWYVMHDDDVSSTTDGTGNISEMTSTQVNALHIDTGANVDKYSQSELIVPTAEKAIQIANRYGMNICFRISDMPTTYESVSDKAIWDSFIELIRSYAFEHGAFSGSVEQIQCLRGIVGENWEGSYFGTGTESADTLIGLLAGMTNMSVIIQYSSLTAEGVKKLHKNGIKVYAYSTTPSNAELLNASDMGVDIFQNAYAYKLNMPTT